MTKAKRLMLTLGLMMAISALVEPETFVNQQLTMETYNAYILQGQEIETMIAAVNSVGGELSHQFKVIDALSVRLTPNQALAMSSDNPGLHLMKDSQVTTSSYEPGWDVSKALEFKLDKNKLTWLVKNNTGTDLHVEKLTFSWPEANGLLTKLQVNENTLTREGASATSFTLTLPADQHIEIDDTDPLKVELKFEQISTINESSYSLVAQMSDGSQVKMLPNNEERASSPIRYDIVDKALKWKTLNVANKALFVSQVIIDWPEENGQIKKFTINEQNLLTNPLDGGQASLPLETHIKIKKNEELNIKMTFHQLSSVSDSDYSVLLMFNDGTQQSFTTTNSTPIQGKNRDTFFPAIVNADQAHLQGITGQGVTVAVIDTGITGYGRLKKNSQGNNKILHVHNVLDPTKPKKVKDDNGHGTHITSIIANRTQTYTTSGNITGSYNGIAPDANLFIVKAFNKKGVASYSDILTAIEYVIANREAFNIKVLNLSFSAPPSSYYWNDPINQAVMRAWQAGITVVAAAGNKGPDAMTIGVPGNTPYIITVGATSDNYTQDNNRDDFVTSFSSSGPTIEGFIKPDLVAPGGHIQGLLNDTTYIGQHYAMYNDDNNYFLLSGSSQASAITSGIVALMLQQDPNLSPNDIKCRLMHSAKLATTNNGELAFSLFQDRKSVV